MSSQIDSSLSRPVDPSGRIFIKNLEKTFDDKSLNDTFAAFGTILSSKVAVDDKGQCRGYAFVNFETKAAADSAIEKLNGTMLLGQPVVVGCYIPRECSKGHGEYQRQFVNVFVKNFGDAMDDSSLLALFEKYGTVTSHTVMKDDNGKSRGFGFVSFERPEHAELACKELNGTEMNGQNLYVARAQKRAERQRERLQDALRGLSLYVKNLDEGIDDEMLRKEFAHCGNIKDAFVIKEGGRSKGFGFVCFATLNEANTAAQEMNGKMVGGQPLHVVRAKPPAQNGRRLPPLFLPLAAQLRPMMRSTQPSRRLTHPRRKDPESDTPSDEDDDGITNADLKDD